MVKRLSCMLQKRNYVEIIELLLSHTHTNVNAQDNDGKTALMYATERNYEMAIELLLSHERTHVNEADNNGKTALMYATERNYVEIIELLLSHTHTNVNAQDNDGKTALMYATERNYEMAIQLEINYVPNRIIAHTHDINIQDNDGKTALMQKNTVTDLSLLDFFIDHGLELGVHGQVVKKHLRHAMKELERERASAVAWRAKYFIEKVQVCFCWNVQIRR